jgi:hypothetical protein
MAGFRVKDPNFSAWVGVLNQGPMLSTTNAFRLEHMLRSTPSAVTAREATVEVGDRAPDFELTNTAGKAVRLADFRGKPLVMRMTRAVTERII